MPFVSRSQVRACYAEKRRNPKSTWDCEEWKSETKDEKSLPERLRPSLPERLPRKTSNSKKNPLKKTPKKATSPTLKTRRLKKDEKIPKKLLVGPRGGSYFVRDGFKVYVPKE